MLRLVVDAHDDWRGQISEPGTDNDWRSTFVGVEAFWAVMAEQLGNTCPNSTFHLDGESPMKLTQETVQKLQDALETLGEDAQVIIGSPVSDASKIGVRWTYSCPYCRAHGEHLPLDHESDCPYYK